jgi:beta-phosphoglucomutase-like phosphatase (HAD superfamily)
VRAVDAILFDPVGALAEFPPGPFGAVSVSIFSQAPPDSVNGSAAYWHLVDLLASRGHELRLEDRMAIEAAELEAADAALVYDDAGPALQELSGLGVRLVAASSLSARALSRVLRAPALNGRFPDRWSRDDAGGVADVVLRHAVSVASLVPDRVLCLADTGAALEAAARAGVRPILMMNDPDEAMRLTAREPAGGIVSLLELPDLVRLVAARATRGETGR